MNQLSVVLARFPFTNQIDYKIRPALIVSNPKFNKIHSFFWLCPITSTINLREFELEIPENEFSGKFKTKSYIRSDSITGLEKELIIKELGKISSNLFE
ncbi:type II toxin-antitoxin system PemK/MazF family toxin, partial [Candidatus Micrarchaeota archaeon]|nr:type II toxin-antitoxin system PemK/MazF family toxin [Candidatus Micrarchaeota archaeon]